MASMIVSPDELERFRNEILNRVDDLRNQLKKTEAAMDAVAEDWKDHQFKKYNEEFSRDKDEIEPLCKKLEEYEADVLYPLWEIADGYGNL